VVSSFTQYANDNDNMVLTDKTAAMKNPLATVYALSDTRPVAYRSPLAYWISTQLITVDIVGKANTFNNQRICAQ